MISKGTSHSFFFPPRYDQVVDASSSPIYDTVQVGLVASSCLHQVASACTETR